jgi:hypothetical protein
MPQQIETKEDFLSLSAQAKVGNQFIKYANLTDLEAAIRSGECKATHITIRNRVANSPYFEAVVPIRERHRIIDRLVKWGARVSDLYFQDIPTPNKNPRVANVEAMLLPETGGFYALEGSGHDAHGDELNLRHDLEQNGRVHEGFAAYWFLKGLGADVWEDLNELWREYPDSVVEFTVFTRPVGIFNRRMLVWEVRNY